jgi:hypothetical protein
MICPPRLTTQSQPIAMDDVPAHLLDAKDMAGNESPIVEIGSTDVVIYGDQYVKQQKLRLRLRGKV